MAMHSQSQYMNGMNMNSMNNGMPGMTNGMPGMTNMNSMQMGPINGYNSSRHHHVSSCDKNFKKNGITTIN